MSPLGQSSLPAEFYSMGSPLQLGSGSHSQDAEQVQEEFSETYFTKHSLSPATFQQQDESGGSSGCCDQFGAMPG